VVIYDLVAIFKNYSLRKGWQNHLTIRLRSSDGWDRTWPFV